jgi:hypothetical protein
MAKQKRIADEEGNELQGPDPSDPVYRLIYLLEYGRRRGFRIGPQVQIDGLIVQVQDIRQANAAAREMARTPDITPGSDMAVLLGEGDE